MTSFEHELSEVCRVLDVDLHGDGPTSSAIVAAAILTAGSWIADALAAADGDSVGDKLSELSWEAQQRREEVTKE